MKTLSGTTRAVAAGALVLLGFGAGAIVAVTAPASASGDAPSRLAGEAAEKLDPSKIIRSDERLLSGGTASRVRTAALAKYPGASVQRLETDSDGVYEAHLVTVDGDEVTVQVDKDFTVTGTETGGHGRHGGGHGGHGVGRA